MISLEEYIACLWHGRLVTLREFHLLLDVQRAGGIMHSDQLRYHGFRPAHTLVECSELVWFLDREFIGFGWIAKLPFGRLCDFLRHEDNHTIEFVLPQAVLNTVIKGKIGNANDRP